MSLRACGVYWRVPEAFMPPTMTRGSQSSPSLAGSASSRRTDSMKLVSLRLELSGVITINYLRGAKLKLSNNMTKR